MLPIVDPATAILAAVQVIVLAAIAGAVTVYGRKLDGGARDLKAKLEAELLKTAALEKRIKRLEAVIRRFDKTKPKK